ncbi:MAG: hypothetical protein GEV05_24460 [Betaproteobacteria bacterium]|nr:hypothetical protein [Betaproteobacteria bacterium]
MSRVRLCQRLPTNASGHDLVVGDLHGHRSLLDAQLERLHFDPARDRVLSVGDLVNRGPESLATLSLIEEPWFHAVLGNHELMLLNYLHYYDSRTHSRKAFACGSGQWIHEAIAKNRKFLGKLADRLAALPLALHVEGAVSFNVTHSALLPIGLRQKRLLRDETVCVHRADAATSSRLNIGEALTSGLFGLRFAEHSVQISDTPIGALPITYVGHSPIRHVTVHNSYVYIDQGVRVHPGRSECRPPTVIDHAKFSFWLGGVVTARERMSTGAGA